MQGSSIEALGRAGMEALERGDAAAARRSFEQIVASGQAPAPAWILLAQACRQAGDAEAERDAIDQALAVDPRNLRAMIMKGDWFSRRDDIRAATSFYQFALKLVPAGATLPPGLAADLARAEAAVADFSRRYEGHLTDRLAQAGFSGDGVAPRVQESIDILLGNKQLYFQQPTSYFFPGLPQIQFYERSQFPWVAALEQAVPEMQAELAGLIEEREAAFKPYVEVPTDRAFNQSHAMLNNPDWSALYLWKNGALVEENASRCPRTMEALTAAPIPHIRTRSPMVLFSRLKPGTHIPPHNGMLNTRLICHIPLIVPPACRLRVGNEIRQVEEGKALIFDDSIEHEAWNDSDKTRIVLLLEVWRPEISEDERRALTALFEAINEFGGTGETPAI